jgi:radical SAM protein with 4Fe4S-binding SPASM domain
MFAGLRPLGVKTIDIIGGEPTMHPDIVRIIREAGAQEFRVNLSSNGDNIGALEMISKAGVEVTIGLSINDRRTLGHCSAFIRKHRPVAKTVFSRGMDPGMIDDILALAPKQFYLIYRDAGRREDLHAIFPFYRFLDDVRRLSCSRNIGTVFCSGFIPDAEQYPELGTVRCPAGTTKLGVMPDGSVYPCNLFFGKKEFFLGNILSDPFETIWSNPALDFFRAYSGNRCAEKACELHARCHGGCPAQSFLISGDLAAPDPRCSHADRHDLPTGAHSRFHGFQY